MSLTKKLTIFITTVLATFCAFLGFATLRPATAFAYTENSTARFDDKALIAQEPGTNYIHYSWQYDPNGFYSEDIKVVLNVNLYETSTVSTGWESVDQNVTFNDLNTLSYNKLESHEITIYYEYSPRSTVARKNGVEHTYSYNKTTLEPLVYIGEYSNAGDCYFTPLKTWFEYKDTNAIITNKFTLDFVIKTQSPYTNYVLGISTTIDSYDRGTGTLFSDRDYKGTFDGNGQKPFTSVSPIKSLANIVNMAVENNSYVMEYTRIPVDYGVKSYIDGLYNKLIVQSLERNFTVYYLQPVADNVPFAKKVSKEITLTVDKNATINAVDVCKALGVEYFEIFGTIYNGIEEDGDVLTVKYPCDLWLASKTVDGKTVNNFLNINVSYQEYFGTYVQNEVIDQGLYEYLFANAIANKYPEVATQGLSYGDVYGYWDYVVLPETVGLNSLLADVLGTKSNYVGFTKEFHFESSISKQQYQMLLEKYNYNWLESGWNSIFGTGTTAETHNATHYILICDPYLKDGFVDGSGGDETDKNAGGSVGEQVGDDIRDDVNGVIDWGKDFIAGIGDVLSGKASFGSYVSLILLAVAVVGVIWLFNGGAITLLTTTKTRTSASKPKTRRKNNGKRKK